MKARDVLAAQLFGLLLVGAVALGSFLWQAEVPLAVRDLGLAVVADYMDGEAEDWEVEMDYIGSQAYNVLSTNGIVTNSRYLYEQTVQIVPFMAYEKIKEKSQYPMLVLFSPVTDSNHFHLGGWARVETYAVRINDRYVMRDELADERQVLGILVHEIIHIQGGNFASQSGAPDWVEPRTEAATLEVLAAMCNFRKEAACAAFWSSIGDFARTSFRARMGRWNLSWLANLIMNVTIYDGDAQRSFRKSMRFWEDDPGSLQYILEAYSLRPWEEIVLPGVCGDKLDTGNVGHIRKNANGTWTVDVNGYILGMPFDDTADLLGIFRLACLIN